MHPRTRIPLLAAVAACLCATLAPAGAPAQANPRPRIAPPEEPGPSRSTVERIPEPGAKRGGIIRRIDREEAVEGELRLGEAVRSELDRGDRREDDNTYYEDWVFRGVPGTRVTITMSSSDFDTYLGWGRMLDGEFQVLAADDDGGEETNSRVTVWIRDGEEYVVRANSFSAGSGRFRLFVEEAGPAPDPGAPRGVIEPGQTVRGELGAGDALLSSGRYYEVWRLRGRPGQRVTITLASADFDARLGWARMVGGEALSLATDDDSGDGTDSELSVELEDGEYALIVSTTGVAQTGAYTLRVRTGERGAYSLR